MAAEASTSHGTILNVHTPTSSFAVIHSLNQESLTSLFNKLSSKVHKEYPGQHVGPEWLKYDYGDAVWDLNDDSDYTIFSWRQQSYVNGLLSPNMGEMTPTIPAREVGGGHPSQMSMASTIRPSPTLYLHNPNQPLPVPPTYVNTSYYAFRPTGIVKRAPSVRSSGEKSSGRGSRRKEKEVEVDDGVPKLMKQFQKFHSGNGVRTVMGSIGPVKNVRMLLKIGYRHVYISRKFAQNHGFIPSDATPGNYGYGGLVNIGTWPITLVTSSSSGNEGSLSQNKDHVDGISTGVGDGESLMKAPMKARRSGLEIDNERRAASLSEMPSPNPSFISNTIVLSTSRSSVVGASPQRTRSKRHHLSMHQQVVSQQQQKRGDKKKPTVTNVQVYLCEEPHFDVVLGRSFFDKRQIQTSPIDPTEVICLDNGEKIECEVVILRDGKGDIVTVT